MAGHVVNVNVDDRCAEAIFLIILNQLLKMLLIVKLSLINVTPVSIRIRKTQFTPVFLQIFLGQKKILRLQMK